MRRLTGMPAHPKSPGFKSVFPYFFMISRHWGINGFRRIRWRDEADSGVRLQVSPLFPPVLLSELSSLHGHKCSETHPTPALVKVQAP